MAGIIRAVIRATLFALWILVALPVHLIWYALTRRMDVPRIWHRVCCVLFGITVRVHGDVRDASDIPVLFVSNHVSYLDIIVLGGFLDVRFVAKKEVADWPLFGFLAKIQHTVFIDRARSALEEARRAFRAALDKGVRVVLFPEGTSTNGASVVPFKSALFSVLAGDEDASEPPVRAWVHPVAIVLTMVDGQPVATNPDLRDVYAWYGDMVLVPHLWTLARHKSVEVALYILPALDTAQYTDRRVLADTAHDMVADCVRACQVLPS